jgi:RhoGEF domain
MIMPVQRTPRYYLLFEQLVKFTPPDHVDHQPASLAIETIKRATNSMNERLPLPLQQNVQKYIILIYIQ